MPLPKLDRGWEGELLRGNGQERRIFGGVHPQIFALQLPGTLLDPFEALEAVWQWLWQSSAWHRNCFRRLGVDSKAWPCR